MYKKQLFFIAIICLIICVVCAIGYQVWQNNGSQPVATNLDTHQKTAEEIKADKLVCVAAMPLNERIGQKLMAAGYADLLENETATFAAANIGGVILMDEASADQVAAFRGAMPIPPTVAVDQEGGTVQRYKSEGTLPGNEQIVSDGSADEAYQKYLSDDRYLQSIGITTNFAPVVDIASHTPSPLPGRMYSNDPSVVTAYAASSIKAADEAGITPVIKHFPGLGSATGNTDFIPATTDPLALLESRDLIPYKELSSLHPDVMIGNMIVPDLTDGQPAIWSKKAVDLLRSLGYEDAVTYTDSLTAHAVPGNLDEAVIKSWQAGIDIALIVQERTDTPNLAGYFQSILALAQSSEIDSDTFNASVLRIFARKHIDPCTFNAS